MYNERKKGEINDMLSSELCLKYIGVKNKLKDFYQKAAENDTEYTKNFPRDKSIDERLEYNQKYEIRLGALDDERKIICSEVEAVEDEIKKVAPDFVVHKYH